MEVWNLFSTVFLSIKTVCEACHIFGTNLWVLLIGFFATSVIFGAVRFLFYSKSGGDK